jgi:poly [ADP-ribose] polymerase
MSNFVGILTQGLRIAPPEAPASGYLYGKGAYFADLIEKSTNYTCYSSTNNEFLILLCQVAVGN